MRRQLALITLLVVGAHLWLLQHADDIVQPGLPGAERLVIRPMQTRPIVPAPPSPRAGDGVSAPTPPDARVAAVPAAAPAPRASALSLQAAGTATPATAPTLAAETEVGAGTWGENEPPVAKLPEMATSATPPPATTPAPIPEPTAAALAPPDPDPGPDPAARRASAAGTPPLAIPGSMSLRYLVSATSRGRPYQVHGTLQWQHDGERYQARLEISAFLLGARVQTSVGRIGPDGLAPTRFGDRLRSEQATHFQRDKGVISFSNNAPDAPLAPGAQDRLSVILQLGALLAGAPQRYPAGTVIALQTAGVREAEPWQFSVVGPEQQALPGGVIDTVKLLRLPRREFDQTIELWLAPGLQYLPVRVRITQGNGDVADQQWLSSSAP